MGISERRERERVRRRNEILDAAWAVAREVGWASFSVEKVAVRAELARGTIYSYFTDIEDLVLTMAQAAFDDFSNRLKSAISLTEALDVPVRFSQQNPAGFYLLFPQTSEARSHLSNPSLDNLRMEARETLGALERITANEASHLPRDSRDAAAFLSGIGMAGALVPELRANTSLRRRWQDFCLGAETDDARRNRR